MRDRLEDKYTFLIREYPLSTKDEQLIEALGRFLKDIRVARIIYNYIRGDLNQLFNISPEELLSLPYVNSKHVEIITDLKLIAKNIIRSPLSQYKYQLTTPEAVYGFIYPYLLEEERELFIGIPLNSSLVPVSYPVVISIGTNIESILHPAYYYKVMIRLGALSSIAVHNHPSSGDPFPSKEDIETTKTLVKAGELLGIPLKDHIIIGNGSYYSFAASGNLKKFYKG